MSKKLIALITVLVLAVVGVVTGVAVNVNIENSKIKATIEYSSEPAPAEIAEPEEIEGVESGQGEIKVDGEEIPTVESVDATGQQVNPEEEDIVECPEGEECGRGAVYPHVNTSTPQAFLNATLGGCYDIDGHFNEQCWDYAALFFLNYAGHTFYTCGSGAAKGAIVDGCWQKNAGNEFVMIWDATKLQAGDWVVFNNGQYGHVGMATGSYNHGYITLAGQNQGGGLCPGSSMGGKVNIINISTKYFAGAFRPKSYIKPEPKPEPEPEPKPAPKPAPAPVVDRCKVRTVVKGDTMAKIMKECKGYVKWGSAMNQYASSWYSTKLNKPVTVYYGWTHGTGYGLLAGDVIEYRGQ